MHTVETKEGIERLCETSVKRRLQISATRNSLIALRGVLAYIETLALAVPVTFSDNGPPVLRFLCSPTFSSTRKMHSRGPRYPIFLIGNMRFFVRSLTCSTFPFETFAPFPPRKYFVGFRKRRKSGKNNRDEWVFAARYGCNYFSFGSRKNLLRFTRRVTCDTVHSVVTVSSIFLLGGLFYSLILYTTLSCP